MSIALVVLAAALLQDGEFPVVPPDSVARLIDLAGLPRLTPGVTCRQFASTDPSGRGDDHGHYLRVEGKRAVLAEMEGPGVLARLWSANAQGRLKIYFDGESEPRIDTPFQDLFTGKYPPFVEPIAIHQGGGWISYFPIPYAKSCRVVVDELDNPGSLYYQVQYLTYPKTTPIRTFTRELPESEKASLEQVLEIWKHPGALPKPPLVPNTVREALRSDPLTGRRNSQAESTARDPVTGDYTICRGGREHWLGRDPTDTVWIGAGILRFLRLDVVDPTPRKLRALVISIAFDDCSGASVSVPAADLFGCGYGIPGVRGLLAGWNQDGGYCWYPMPFRHRLAVTLQNAEPIEIEAYLELCVRDRTIKPPTDPNGRSPAVATIPEDFGYFHAEFRQTDQVSEPLYEFANAKGPGKYVGVNMTLQGVGDLWYLEGNEEFTVDGESRPSVVGTGTEDFYNGGWYWDSGPFSLPLHGLGVKEEWTTNRTTPFRMQMPDAIPFQRSLVARIEHGSSNEVLDACYSSVAFWYAKEPSPVHRVTDEEARLPRQWVKRPKGSLAAVDMQWSAESAMKPTRWEEVSTGWRGCEYSLYQAFPVSHFERDRPKIRPEFAALHGSGSQATFQIDEGDRYRIKLSLVGRPRGPKAEVLVDGKAIGSIETDDSPKSRESDDTGKPAGDANKSPAMPAPEAAPLASPELGVVGLAKGEHTLSLRVLARDATNAAGASDSEDSWLGLDAVTLESAAPYVKSWWVAPPVECDPKGTVEQAPTEEAGFLAADFDPATHGWKEVADAGDVADLNHWVTTKAPIFGYLATWVFSPELRVVRARLGSDDGVRVWVNRELQWSNAVHRPITPDADRFDVKLEKGWNLLLVKVRNDDGGYALSLRLADPDGTLRCATKRE